MDDNVWIIAASIVFGSFVISMYIEKALVRIADRIDNASRILGHIQSDTHQICQASELGDPVE